MKIESILNENELDAIYVSDLNNIRYLCGFTGTTALLLVSKDTMFLYVDSRYFQQAQQQTKNINVVLTTRGDARNELRTSIKENNFKRIGFEQDYVTYQDYQKLSLSLDVNWVPISLSKIRSIKNEAEIAIIKEACAKTDLAYQFVLDTVKVGMSERLLVNKLHQYLLDNDIQEFSFETIVASGKRGAFPHGVASDKIIELNDMITLDFGIMYQGYCSDMTRSFVVGSNPNPKIVEIYNIVKEAQLLAIKAVKPFMKANELDAVARDYITKAGYGEYFQHGLGHSFGLQIHEYPSISYNSDAILYPNTIITIEPGIYIPDLGGIRIEDDILITEDGYEVLTKSSKELIKVNN